MTDQPPVPDPASGPATPGPPPLGTLRLHVQGSRLIRMIAPVVTINGQRVPVKFGVNDIPVYAGPTTVEASTSWLRTYGQAQQSFEVPAGTTVEIWYAIPMHQFTTGSMGFEKQRPKGIWVLITLLVLALVIVALAVLLSR